MIQSIFDVAVVKAEALYDPTDCLINNAGVMLLGQVDSQYVNEWKNMFDVNVIGLLNGMQSVLSRMKARNTGTIINISPIAGKINNLFIAILLTIS